MAVKSKPSTKSKSKSAPPKNNPPPEPKSKAIDASQDTKSNGSPTQQVHTDDVKQANGAFEAAPVETPVQDTNASVVADTNVSNDGAMTVSQIERAIETLMHEINDLNAQLAEKNQTRQRMISSLMQKFGLVINSAGIQKESPPKKTRKVRVKGSPITYLKIVVKRAFESAERSNTMPDAARRKAVEAALMKARHKYADSPELQPYLADGKLPPQIDQYIDSEYDEYRSKFAASSKHPIGASA